MNGPVFEIIDQGEPSDAAIAALARLLLSSVDDAGEEIENEGETD